MAPVPIGRLKVVARPGERPVVPAGRNAGPEGRNPPPAGPPVWGPPTCGPPMCGPARAGRARARVRTEARGANVFMVVSGEVVGRRLVFDLGNGSLTPTRTEARRFF